MEAACHIYVYASKLTETKLVCPKGYKFVKIYERGIPTIICVKNNQDVILRMASRKNEVYEPDLKDKALYYGVKTPNKMNAIL